MSNQQHGIDEEEYREIEKSVMDEVETIQREARERDAEDARDDAWNDRDDRPVNNG